MGTGARGATPAAPSMTCPFEECDGSGFVVTGEGIDMMARECRCQEAQRQARRVERLFAQAGISRRYVGRKLNSFDPALQPAGARVAHRYVEQWERLRNEGTNGLYLAGPTGTGKTHLVAAILQELVEQGVPVLFQAVPDLLDLLRPGSGSPEQVAERLQAVKTTELIALDDLGAERETPWATERLYVIINARYNARLPTLVTSNVPPEELEVHTGWERLVSRILEMCHLVILDGADYRKGRDTSDTARQRGGKGVPRRGITRPVDGPG